MPVPRFAFTFILSLAMTAPVGPATPSSLTIRQHVLDVQGHAGAIQILHLQAGAQAPADGLPAGVGRWYIGSPEQIAEVLGSAGHVGHSAEESRVATRDEQPLELAIRPRINPSHSAIFVGCDLPGSETAKVDLFDVMGRRVAGREIRVTAPGHVEISLGADLRLTPGSYWVKLAQGPKIATARIVISR